MHVCVKSPEPIDWQKNCCVYSMIMSQVLGKENVPGRYSLKLTVFIARLASF